MGLGHGCWRFWREQKSRVDVRSLPESSHFHQVKINFPKKMDKITEQSLKRIASRPQASAEPGRQGQDQKAGMQ
jgi:hypothetical protein